MTDSDLHNLRVEQRRFGHLGACTDAGLAMEAIVARIAAGEAEAAADDAAFEAAWAQPWQDATQLLRPREHLRRLAERLRAPEHTKEAA